MIKLFGGFGERKPPQPDLAALGLDRLRPLLEQAQQRGDAEETARLCYHIGAQYMDGGDNARAILYLCRCDAAATAYGGIHAALGGALLDDCSARLIRLGSAPVLTTEITAQVVERSAALGELRVRQWGLLTMARLSRVGRRLSVLQGCQALGRLGQTVKLVLRSLYQPISPEETGFLQESCSQIYHLVDSPVMMDPDSRVPAPDGPLEALDLNGGMTYTQLNLYLENHLRFLEGQDIRPDARLVPCALLSDYYLRSREGPLEDMPPIRAELRRIQEDQRFLREGPSREELAARVRAYLEMDILEEASYDPMEKISI